MPKSLSWCRHIDNGRFHKTGERLFVDLDKIEADDEEDDRSNDNIGERRWQGIAGDIANTKTDDSIDKLKHCQRPENAILNINILWNLKSQHPS